MDTGRGMVKGRPRDRRESSETDDVLVAWPGALNDQAKKQDGLWIRVGVRYFWAPADLARISPNLVGNFSIQYSLCTMTSNQMIRLAGVDT